MAPRRPRVLSPFVRVVGACVLLVGIYYLVPVDPHVPAAEVVVRAVLSLLGVLAAAWLVARQIRRQLSDSAETPLAGLVIALVAGVLLFALVDFRLATTEPGQFVALETRTDALYFALSTLATVGFGDVYAAGQSARLLVSIQILFNLIVIAAGGSVLANQIGRRVRERARRPTDDDLT
jgi:hypothetical protein